MSSRLGSALAEYIRRMPGAARFVLVEGVPASLAEGMCRAWDTWGDAMPPLGVVSGSRARFGRHALRDVSGTRLRNEHPGGVVLVLCEGEQVPDRQSLSLFESVAPGVLLDRPEGLAVLAQQRPAVALDGPLRAVREAINQTGVASRPSASAVADYFDRLAAGEDPLRAMPALGGFTDTATAGVRVESDRVGDNLALAAQRTSEELLRPAAYADLRRRAANVLGQRPALRDRPGAAEAEADAVMALLQSGSDDLLSRLQFDEAREILEQRPQDLAALVAAELDGYRRKLDWSSSAAALPWDSYARTAESLRHRGPRQRAAARDLCDLDDAQQRQVFVRRTRAKLERLLRDKAVNGSNPSCPEAALAKAAQQLGGLIQRVQVLAPTPPSVNGRANRSGAGSLLTLACARLRLGALMRRWDEADGEIDGLLLKRADADDVLGSFADAGLAAVGSLPALQLRLYGGDGSTVQVEWKPDLDDAALLRAALLFADHPALTLTMAGEPTLHAFCGPNQALALPVPDSLLPLAQHLSRVARD